MKAASQAEDFATGAAHVHRYLQFDPALLASEAAAAGDSEADPRTVMEAAREQLAEIISIKFDLAAERGDSPETER